MKKAILWILLALAIVFFISDHAKNKASLKQIEKEYGDYKAISEETIKIKDQAILEKEDKIAELSGYVDSSNTFIMGLEDKLAVKDDELEELRKSWGNLSLECKSALNMLDAKWTEKFSVAQNEIEEYKKQVRAYDEKELYYRGIILDMKAIAAEKDKQVVACETAAKDIAKLYLNEQKANRLKTVTMVGLAVGGFALGKL